MKNKRPGRIPTFLGHGFSAPVHPWSHKAVTNLCGPKIVSRALAGSAILHDVVSDLLTIAERTHAGALYRGDMDENVRAAIIRLNEAEALGGVKPLYCTSVHNDFLS
jgi:hypothetical protein